MVRALPSELPGLPADTTFLYYSCKLYVYVTVLCYGLNVDLYW